ncbi:unnamed protein product [Spirodela intermedia]|uniref:Exostosin GT47 domain-containing protein n=1 Tax=Spirodela intermedia TaxID=51605 RepID=A0A7I8KXE9_SPIIN|nr:unnamed protein product [Spirodela intermedia]
MGGGSAAHPAASEKAGGAAGLLEVEKSLARARAAIRRSAAAILNSSSPPFPPLGNSLVFQGGGGSGEFVPSGEVYRNPAAFYRSYLEMERRFKVYVYEEGEPPLAHAGPCKGLYTTEGRFINAMEDLRRAAASATAGGGRGLFLTEDPSRAHAFFMPFSVAMMVRFAYREGSYDLLPLRRLVAGYVRSVAARQPFWNRSAGTPPLPQTWVSSPLTLTRYLALQGPHVSRADPRLFFNSIRVLCNANTSEGFDPGRDVSLPEINLRTGELPVELLLPPPVGGDRPILAFFAGAGDHGPIRPALLRHWRGREEGGMSVHEQLPGGATAYYGMMRRSRFCLCPSGYEVASPRVAEAVYAGCVPVLISEGYVAPFGDVLRWEAFSLAVAPPEIPRLRGILTAVPEAEYRRLQANVGKVKRHFLFNSPPKRFDVFHMILHSVWLRRLNIRLTWPNPTTHE